MCLGVSGSYRLLQCNGDLYEAAGAADATSCSRIGSCSGMKKEVSWVTEIKEVPVTQLRPLLEVADIVRAQGDRFIHSTSAGSRWTIGKYCARLLAAVPRFSAGIATNARAGYRTTSYNSCRDRHCPKCQSGARDKWILARQSELLPVAYVHVVFTLPHQLSPLALQNKKVLYDLLFRASTETLQEVARDPSHLGADIGFLSVLHTWGQNCLAHPHVHCVIPAGGLLARPHPLDPIPATHSSCPFTYSVASSAASSSQV